MHALCLKHVTVMFNQQAPREFFQSENTFSESEKIGPNFFRIFQMGKTSFFQHKKTDVKSAFPPISRRRCATHGSRVSCYL